MVGLRAGRIGALVPLDSGMDDVIVGELSPDPGGEDRGVGREEMGFEARLGSGGLGELDLDMGRGGAGRLLAKMESESMAPGEEESKVVGATSKTEWEDTAMEEDELFRDRTAGVVLTGTSASSTATMDGVALSVVTFPLLNLSRRAFTDTGASSSTFGKSVTGGGRDGAVVGFVAIGVGGMETIFGGTS